MEERDASILRRTLAGVGGLYAFWTAALGVAAWGAVTALNPRLLLLHAGLLALSGVMLWKPRRGAVIVTLLAAAGSIFFVVFDLRRDSIEAALIDAGYPLVAAVLLYKSRRRP